MFSVYVIISILNSLLILDFYQYFCCIMYHSKIDKLLNNLVFFGLNKFSTILS